jgi:hypothetical protein
MKIFALNNPEEELSKQVIGQKPNAYFSLKKRQDLTIKILKMPLNLLYFLKRMISQKSKKKKRKFLA